MQHFHGLVVPLPFSNHWTAEFFFKTSSRRRFHSQTWESRSSVSPCFSQKTWLGISEQEQNQEPKDAEKPNDGARPAESGDGSATEIAPESDEGDAVAEVGEVAPADAVVEAAEGGEAVNGETQEDCWGHGILGGFLCQDQLGLSTSQGLLQTMCWESPWKPSRLEIEVLRHVLVCSLTFYTYILVLHLAGVAGEIESLWLVPERNAG